MSGTVLLLAPSRGLGGGIERYVSTVEAAFQQHGVCYRRLDLVSAERPLNPSGKLHFIREVIRAARVSDGPVRLVLAHRNLLPVVYGVARLSTYAGTTVIVHGSELWSGRRDRGRRMLRRPDVRVVAASAFSAGALARDCRATVLHPGVPAAWYRALVEARCESHPGGNEINLVTAFRLADWRSKGLGTLLEAVSMLDDERIRLTVCGTGPVPADLRAATLPYSWCRLQPDLSDSDLAAQLTRADLFVLCTRTRAGAAASGEGFGLVLLEAQLAGTPVIAPAHGGSDDAFLRNVTGVAPVDETPEALRAVLAPLLADGPRRARMGRAAAMWSRTRFEPSEYGERIIHALLGAVPQPARAGERSPAAGIRGYGRTG
ncbi:glycosyltransferase family 4 protein [Phytoactinopolyspora halotolerans]|uniref:Glycosyltransferase family 4 protein n=1 Tax=Phytoactinopolyspora halotolerans TaxID=1981512 RepID=A0A6L9S502_9ACTN|nr:glycosyltransferase family 4 protein [Phytoactinopolyspora halotolerans]NEE00179.1 glycosyltransferase family 4 protein [Phytoactinopolyspora halotolerans]